MRQNERRLIIAAVATAWLGGLGHSEAIAQRARLLEFGPDTIEIRPPRRAATDTAAVPLDGPDPRERPWVLASVRGLRLPPPPDERDSARERQEMWKLAASDDADALERVRYWDTVSPAQRWHEMLADMSARAELSGAAASRARALLDTAIHEARVAAWDSKNAYRRPRPSELDARLVPEVAVPRGPSYPCEHAVVAGVAAEILGHLFPRDRARLAGAAHEAARSRVVASAVYPSDAKAGLALGRAVAELVIEQAIIGDRERLQEAPAVAGRPPPASAKTLPMWTAARWPPGVPEARPSMSGAERTLTWSRIHAASGTAGAAAASAQEATTRARGSATSGRPGRRTLRLYAGLTGSRTA